MQQSIVEAIQRQLKLPNTLPPFHLLSTVKEVEGGGEKPFQLANSGGVVPTKFVILRLPLSTRHACFMQQLATCGEVWK